MEITIISIAAYARSGTTFLGKVFNYHRDVIFVGEIDQGIKRYMTQPSFVTKQCSCGEVFGECPFWTEVFSRLKDYFTSASYDELIRNEKFLQDLFSTIHRVSGARYIVDSSKGIEHVLRMKRIFAEDHYLLYIIRDPRAIIHSRNKTRVNLLKKGHHPNPRMARKQTLLTFYDAFEWVSLNRKMHASYRSLPQTMFTLYESWEGNFPEKFFEFARFAGLEPVEGYTDPHILMGNINRYQTRDIEFRCDLSWKESMSLFRKSVVTVITYPFILLKGLRFEPSRGKQ